MLTIDQLCYLISTHPISGWSTYPCPNLEVAFPLISLQLNPSQLHLIHGGLLIDKERPRIINLIV
jgi:hypothetical protein